MGAELLHADGRTERHDRIKSRLSQFCQILAQDRTLLVAYISQWNSGLAARE